MIRLEITNSKGKFNLVLKQNTSIRMEHNSPLFAKDVIPGSRTYNFGIPINDINRVALQFPEKLMFNGKVRIYSCNYYFWGRLISSGKLAVLRSNTDYQVQFTVNAFAVEFKDEKITDIIDEEINYIDTVNSANQIITKNYPDAILQYPEIYNDKFYEGAEEENTRYDLLMNRYDSDNSTFLKNYYDSGSGFNENKNTMVPQPYLYHILKSIFSQVGYYLKGEVTTDVNIQKLLIYNNYPLDEFGTLTEQGLNVFKKTFNINQLLPDLKVNEFINAIKDFLQIGVFFDHANKIVLLIYKNSIIDSNGFIAIDGYTPDLNESTLSTDEGYELSYNFDDNSRADLVSVAVNEDEVFEVDTFEDLYPFHGQTENLFYVRNTGQYFRSRESARPDDWSRVSERYFKIINGDGKYKQSLKLGPVLSSTLRGASKGGVVPIMREPGSSDVFSTGKNDPGLKLMVWHGLYNDYDDKQYPFASSINLDNEGNRIGDISLQFSGEDGIYNKYQKKWLDFQTNADKIRVIGKMPIEAYFRVLAVFSSHEDAPRKLRYRGVNFIPEKISALHEMNSDNVEVEFIMHKQSNIEVKLDVVFQELLEVSPSLFSTDAELETGVTALVTSTSQWTAFSNDIWLSISHGSGLGNDYLSFAIGTNNSIDPRTGIITVSNNSKSVDITINQEGKEIAPETILEVSPSQIDASRSTAIYDLNITCNTNWVAVVSVTVDPFYTPDPITLDVYSGSGNGLIKITVPGIPSWYSVTRTITITAGTKEVAVKVYQW